MSHWGLLDEQEVHNNQNHEASNNPKHDGADLQTKTNEQNRQNLTAGLVLVFYIQA
jgi:hypothetical protein